MSVATMPDTAPTADYRPSAWRAVTGALLLIAGVVAVYWPTLQNDYIWDDDVNITENAPALRDDGLVAIWTGSELYQYYPITFTTYWLEYRLTGGRFDPKVSHAVNIGLHATNAVLLMLLFVAMGLKVGWAWLAAALFALHPVQAETVAWATERKNLLAGVFYLTAFLLYVRHMQRGKAASYVGSVVAFALALLAKSVTVTLTASLFLVELWVGRGFSKKSLLRLLPFVALTIGFALIAREYEHGRAGARGDLFTIAPAERLIIAATVPLYYIGRIFAPTDASFIPPRWSVNPSDALAWWPVAVVALAVVLAIALRRQLPKLAKFGVSHYLVTILPATGLVTFYFMRYAFVQDHFQYFAGMGVFLVISLACAAVARRVSAAVAIPVFLAVVIALGAITRQRLTMYVDAETLWTNTLAKNADATIAHYNLASMLAADGKTDAAIEQFDTLLEIDPDDTEAMNFKGTLLGRAGKFNEARAIYQRVLELNPNDANAYNNLGTLYSDLGKDAEATPHFRKATELNSKLAVPHYNYGGVLERTGDTEGAIREYAFAVERRPDYAVAHLALARLLQQSGELEQAYEHYRHALAATPDDASTAYNLGTVELQIGKPADAVKHLKLATELRPQFTPAYLNLATAFATIGDMPAAVEALRGGLKQNSRDLKLLDRLAWYLSTSTDPSVRDGHLAVVTAERARRWAPKDDARRLDTLAAAFAEAGRFDEAVAAATHAVQAARAEPDGGVSANDIQKRLELYQARNPYRE